MQAWTTAGQPDTHPEPWGRPGAFTTFRVFAGGKTPFLDQHLDRLLDSAKRLHLPGFPHLMKSITAPLPTSMSWEMSFPD